MVKSFLGAGTATALTLVASALIWSVDAGSADAARPTCRGKVATIVGTPRDDKIIGTARADVIVGGAGMDWIEGGSGEDIICGGPGSSRVPQDDTAYQLLVGGRGNDVIVGGPDSDVLSDGYGVDLLIGRGEGDYLYTDGKVKGSKVDVLRGGPGPDELSGRHGGRLHGGEGDDRFLGGVDDITLRGGGGGDTFESGRGNDTIIGGPGVDTGVYIFVQQGSGSGSHCNGVTADLDMGVASGVGFGTDTLSGVENLAGGAGEDSLTGDAHANTFFVGLPCANTPVEREFVAGGEGSDRIDFFTYWYSDGSLGPVIADLASGTARKVSPFANPDFQTDALVALDSVENVTGSRFKDTIVGDAGPNRLSGHDSRDLIRGGGGDDILAGSSGPDEIYGEEGDDKLLGEDGNDFLDGGTGSNTVDGGKSRDTCQNPDRYNGALNCEA